MNQRNSTLFIIASTLTLLTGIVWSGVFVKAQENLPSTLPQTGEVNFEEESYQSTFSLEWQKDEPVIASPINQEITIPVILKGSTEDIISAELVFAYDTSKINIISVLGGSLFDFYIPPVIDENAGRVTLLGGNATLKNETEGVFAFVTLERIAEGETSVTILQKDNFELFSKAITTFGSTVSFGGDYVILQ